MTTLDRRTLLSAAALLTLGLHGRAQAARIGQPAPDFSLPDTAGQTVRLADFRDRFVVLEWINPGCPFVRKHYQSGNMGATQQVAQAQGVAWLAINSTEEASGDYLAPAALADWVKQHQGQPSAVLMDPEGLTGRAYDARVTPHMFIVDPQGRLVYAGGIDSIASARVADIEKATNHVKAALADIAAGRPIAQAVTKPYGCTIKYKV